MPPRRRESSLLQAVIDAAADRLAADPRVPLPARQAYRDTAVSVLRQQFSVLVGERVYVGNGLHRLVLQEGAEDKAARRSRIVAALAAGESVDGIACRERVTARWVRRLRQQVK